MARKQLRIGLIGYGFMGRAHSNAYHQATHFFPSETEIVLQAVCGRDEKAAKAFAKKWGYAGIETDWRKLIERDDIDLIDIATPNNLHSQQAIAAAQAGKMILCEKPLGASDYLRLAHDYHTILVDHIPVMDLSQRNAAKRFITLIDALYDNAVKLMASADANPISLYLATEGNEANEFKRTASRLIEMSSESYLALAHGRKDSTASGSTKGLVET